MSLNAYTAVAAKVRAMYGGRMTGDDYRQLMSRTTISDAAAFLQTHRGYREGLSGISTAGLHREQLETAMRRTYISEYRRIFSFLSGADQELLRFPIYQAEKEAILTAMRRLSSRHMLKPETTWAGLLTEKSRLNLIELSQAEHFSEIAEAASGTIYASALGRSVMLQGTEPSMAFVDNILLVTYYAHLYRVLAKNYAGETKKLIKKSLDQETDLLNLVLFLRLRQHFSQEDVQLYSFPLPCSGKLPDSYVQQLLAAENFEAAMELVYGGPYGALFRSVTPTGLEAYLYTMQYRFNRRQLRAAVPTVYTPIAYLGLKEIELRNIISIIECIRYRVDPRAYVTLIGAE